MMSFRLLVSNAEGLTLGPQRYDSVGDAIASATRCIAQQHGTGWRVCVLDRQARRVTAWYEGDASPDTPAPFVGALHGVAAPVEREPERRVDAAGRAEPHQLGLALAAPLVAPEADQDRLVEPAEAAPAPPRTRPGRKV